MKFVYVFLMVLLLIALAVMSYLFILFKRIATIDLMTGLKNRNAYEIKLKQLGRKLKNEEAWIVIYDVDSLKALNFRGGHLMGDRAIIAVADTLKGVFCEKAYSIFRIGGDEFVVIAVDASEDELKIKISKTESILEGFSASKGYARINYGSENSYSTAFKRADEMLFKEKKEKVK
ncbi:MAG: GGDEF domain-containing protein [Clostridia bacterium]|nr:GGDEF domain-containing protein [Clostridia bacterium]